MRRRLLWFALPFGAGCLLCVYLLPRTAWLWAGAGTLAAGAAACLAGAGKPARTAALGLALGMLWCAGYAAAYLDPAERLAGLEDLAEMELADYPEETDYGVRCTVRVRGLRGRAICYGGYELLDFAPGDRVEAAVKYYSAAHPSGGDSRRYTAQGIFLRLYGDELFLAARGDGGHWRYLPQRMGRWLRETIHRLYSPRTAGFLTALLTGERDGLDEQSYSDLREAGLLHVTAVSGLHCGFLIALLRALVFRRRWLTALAAYPALLCYTVMVGCTPPVVRSCVTVGLMLLAPLTGREEDAPTALGASLLALLLANPFAAASVSLQLSFAAVAGLLLPARRIQAFFNRRRPRLGRMGRRLWRFATGSLSASLGVMAFTAPLSAAYFGALSLAAPLSNLLVLWVVPALFAGGLVGTVACGLCPALAPLAVLPELLTRYVLWAAGLAANIPGHAVAVSGPVTVLWMLLAYTLLGLCLLSRDRPRKYLAALLLTAVCLEAARALPRLTVREDRLTAVVVDVGQGAATLLHAGDRTVLVDCGSLNSPRRAGEAVAAAMATYGWGKLDGIILTHCHSDHANGLASLLARVEAERLLLPRLAGDEGAREVKTLAAAYGVEALYVEEPLEEVLGDAALTAYPPVAEGDANEAGLTVLCAAGEFELLMTGDMDAGAERALAAGYRLPDIEVLLAGHHGSRYATSAELLEAVRPEVGVLSVGENRFGHPTEEAMGRMAAAGMTLYRTDWQGNLLIRVHPETGGTDGG